MRSARDHVGLNKVSARVCSRTENTTPVAAHVGHKRKADIRETELQHSGKKKAQTKRRRALNKSSKLRVSDVLEKAISQGSGQCSDLAAAVLQEVDCQLLIHIAIFHDTNSLAQQRLP